MSDTDPAAAPDPYTTPRWVKIAGTIALVIIALILVLWLTRGPGGHGPARHLSDGGAAARSPAPVSLAAITSSAGRTF